MWIPFISNEPNYANLYQNILCIIYYFDFIIALKFQFGSFNQDLVISTNANEILLFFRPSLLRQSQMTHRWVVNFTYRF